MSSTISEDYEPIWDGGETPGPSESRRSGLLSLVVGPVDRPACTIYPPDVAAPYRSTTWLSATSEAFVDLAECR